MPQSEIPPRPHRRRLLAWMISLGVPVAVGALGLGAVAHASADDSGPAVGTAPPDFELSVVYGPAPTFRLSEHRGTPVVVELFASWCEYCRQSTPLVADAAMARRQTDVRFIGVSVDESPAEAIAAVQQWPIPYPVAWDDGRVAWTWNITSLPTVVVIDADGRVAHVGSGAPEPEALERWLADVGAARVE